ncbi:transcription factor iiia [Phtheirospermum japonicum]|uniref:Transcription factor iiia n=1 Tax=Phtheirospermum japonicum TaxID=374723 RepID=A0A830BEU6_9LAMI|nr:transcription factor iiia [Phtheirospermum japonicum]
MANQGDESRGPIFRDIRRYYCEYCGICRSKKSLIDRHILSEHKEEMKENERNKEKESGEKLNICDECGASFQKPAHLKQHMQSHSIERPFTCPVDDCHSSYRRKDHLNRHLLQHQGKLFECPIEDCKHNFTYQGNMTRHVKEFHDESAPANVEHPNEHVCSEHGCGKVFKYPSKLRKHESSHVKLDTVEALCGEPGCMKYFTNVQCLKVHIRSCHQHIICDKCGTKQLKKNFKRHIRMHEEEVSSESIKCSVEGCLRSFSTTSNLKQHIKAVHLELKPFTCSIPGCHMKFAFKHVRDHHEKSGCHVYTLGDFEESDEQFRSRPRGGRKRMFPVIETLTRKRVVPPSESDMDLSSSEEHGTIVC